MQSENGKSVRELLINQCKDCMNDAPYNYCCRMECGQHEFCRGCDCEASKQPEKECH